MTLSTHVQLIDATEAELQELFLVMRDIAGIPPEWPWDVTDLRRLDASVGLSDRSRPRRHVAR